MLAFRLPRLDMPHVTSILTTVCLSRSSIMLILPGAWSAQPHAKHETAAADG